MRILGIDPGLATMGWGVLDTSGSKHQLVECGAIITPPDIFSQVMVAVPMVLLYELSIGLSILFQRRRKAAEAEE